MQASGTPRFGQSRLSRRQFLKLSASAAAVSATTASAQTRPRRTGGTFISAKTTEAPSLDPILEQAPSRHCIDPPSTTAGRNGEPDGKLEPGLAESWTTSRGRENVDLQPPPGCQVPQRARIRRRRREIHVMSESSIRRSARAAAVISRPSTRIEVCGTSTRCASTPSSPARRSWPGMAGGWSSIVPSRGDRAAGGPPADGRRAPDPSSSRSGYPRAISRHAGTRTTGTRASRTWTRSRSRSSPTRPTSSPNSGPATSTTRSSRTTRTTSWSRMTSALLLPRSPRLGFDMVNHQPRPQALPRTSGCARRWSLAVDRQKVHAGRRIGAGLRHRTTHAGDAAMGTGRSRASRSGTRRTPSGPRSSWPTPASPNGFKTTLKVIPTFPTMVAGAQVIAAQLKKVGVDVQIIQEEYGVWIKAIIKPSFDFDLTMNITNRRRRPRLTALPALPLRREAVEQRRRPPQRRPARSGKGSTVDPAKRKECVRQGPAADGGEGDSDLDLRARHRSTSPRTTSTMSSTSRPTTTASAPSGWSADPLLDAGVRPSQCLQQTREGGVGGRAEKFPVKKGPADCVATSWCGHCPWCPRSSASAYRGLLADPPDPGDRRRADDRDRGALQRGDDAGAPGPTSGWTGPDPCAVRAPGSAPCSAVISARAGGRASRSAR